MTVLAPQFAIHQLPLSKSMEEELAALSFIANDNKAKKQKSKKSPSTTTTVPMSHLNSNSISFPRQEELQEFIDDTIADMRQSKEWQEIKRIKKEVKKLRKLASLERTRNMKALKQLYELREENETLHQKLRSVSPFEKVLHHNESLKDFREFCQKEHNSENVDFWNEVNNFKELTSGEERLHVGQAIFDKYIAYNADHNLNISEEQRSHVLEVLTKGQTTKLVGKQLFDNILDSVYRMMFEDSFSRYSMSASGKHRIRRLTKHREQQE